jgi:hypothetical protein
MEVSERFYDVWEALGLPTPTPEEKIYYWMKKYKGTHHALWQLETAAKNVIDAYTNRFGTHHGYVGPIDEEIKALQEQICQNI